MSSSPATGWRKRLQHEWLLLVFAALVLLLALLDPRPVDDYRRWLQLPTLAGLTGLLIAIQGIRDSGLAQHAAAASLARAHSLHSLGLLLVTLVAGRFQALGQREVEFLGFAWSLDGLSGVMLYLLGFAGEVFVLASVYMVMPVGRLSLPLALVGGLAAALLWEVSRHLLVWYFGTLSQIGTVYGSLTTAIAVLLSLEIGATLLLFGAQVIAEFERLEAP